MKLFFGILLGLSISLIVYSVGQIKAEASQESYHITRLTGHSMEQYGLFDGMRVRILHEMPRVGDLVSFKCKNDKCPQKNMVKKLTKQDGDCYWFQGRDDQWYDEEGKVKRSFDSRSYGWVCRDDLIINGIVKNETGNKETKMFVSK